MKALLPFHAGLLAGLHRLFSHSSRRGTLCLLAIVAASGCARAAETANTAWTVTYDTTQAIGEEEGMKVAVDSSGNVFAVGTTEDNRSAGWVLKKYAAANGSMLWHQLKVTLQSSSPGTPTAMVVDATGVVFVTGIWLNQFYVGKYSGADGSLLWEVTLREGTTTNQASGITLDAAGNPVVTGYVRASGSNRDAYTVKYASATGTVIWERYAIGLPTAIAEGTAVAVDGSGNVLMAGSRNNFVSAGSFTDFYVAKYAAGDGSVLWEQGYSGGNNVDRATAITVDAAGNALVTGYARIGATDDYYTTKLAAADGALIWGKAYNGTGFAADQASCVGTDAAGNVIVSGTSRGTANDDYQTIKYAAADGVVLWEKRYNGTGNGGDGPVALGVSANGDVTVSGISRGASPSFDDIYTTRYAAGNGALVWERRYAPPTNSSEEAMGMVLDAADNAVVVGTTPPMTSDTNLYVAKYAGGNGSVVWESAANSPAHSADVGSCLALAAGGDVFVAGRTERPTQARTSNLRPVYLARHAGSNGALLWETIFDGVAHFGARAEAIAVDAAGDLAIVGVNTHATDSTADDLFAAKFSGSTGALLWSRGYNAVTNSLDWGHDLALDGAGNVLVTAYSATDYYTAKYAAATGAILWERRYDGPGTTDVPSAIVVDADGNAVVTGQSSDAGNVADYYTAKYAAGNGAILWEKRYNGAANGADRAYDVALDAAGNVYVTGSSPNAVPNADCYTAKYAAATGNLIWEKRYDGPGGGDDMGLALAVDGSGNVVVTALSLGNGSNVDYYTVKYAAADGALLWEARHNGPGNGMDRPQAVELDAAGNAFVHGWSVGTTTDYCTLKYAAADGSLMWEKRMDRGGTDAPDNSGGGGTSQGVARGLAVDSSGAVIVTGSSQFREGTNSAKDDDIVTLKYVSVAGTPELSVEHPEGTPLVSGTGTVDFGMVAPGQTPSLSFTIRNTGTAPLTGLTRSVSGGQAADFAPGSLALTELPPGGSTALSVVFSATETGIRQATLSIGSNDGPFEIALSARALAAREAWRMTHFSSPENTGQGADAMDADGDGFDNDFEYVAGLLPGDAASNFRSRTERVEGEPAQQKIIFSPRLPGRTYIVEYRNHPITGPWLPLLGAASSDEGDERTVTDVDLASPVKIYRIRITLP